MLEQGPGIPGTEAEQLEELLCPLQEKDIPLGEIQASIGRVALLGAISRLGVKIEDKGKMEFEAELRNPKAGVEPVVTQGSITNCTAEYQTQWLLDNTPAPAPLALTFYPPGFTTIYTTDSNNPIGAILGVHVQIEGKFFRAVLNNGELRGMMFYDLTSPSKSQAITVNCRRGSIAELSLSQSLAITDPVLEKSRRLFRRIGNLRRSEKLGEQVLVGVDLRLVRDSYVDLASFLGVDLEAKEGARLLEGVGSLSADEILRQVFERVGRSEHGARILNILKEDIVETKEHGLVARFDATGDRLRLVEIKDFGRTTHLIPRFKETLLSLADEERGHTLLMLFQPLVNIIDEELKNLAAVVSSGNISAHREPTD